MVLQTCHEKECSHCSGLINLHLDPLIWETVGPRTHKPEIVNEYLGQCSHFIILAMFGVHRNGLCFKLTTLSAKTQSDRDIQRGICYGLITSSLLPKIV